MSIIRRIARAAFWGVLVGGLLWILKRWLSSHIQGPTTERAPQEPLRPRLLHRDPYCGTYVAPEVSFPFEQSGQIEYFCSAECRACYARSVGRAASA